MATRRLSRIKAGIPDDLELVKKVFWSIAVQHIFNVLYYDYAIASQFTPGRFAAYRQPGRTSWLGWALRCRDFVATGDCDRANPPDFC